MIILLAVNGTISVFYYLRIVSAMFRKREGAPETAVAQPPMVAGVAIAVLTLVVVALGLYPSPMLSLIGLFTGP